MQLLGQVCHTNTLTHIQTLPQHTHKHTGGLVLERCYNVVCAPSLTGNWTEPQASELREGRVCGCVCIRVYAFVSVSLHNEDKGGSAAMPALPHLAWRADCGCYNYKFTAAPQPHTNLFQSAFIKICDNIAIPALEQEMDGWG